MRSHRVSWNDPRTLTELVSECKFVVVLVGFFVETEGYERETGAVLLRHDEETQLFQRIREVVGCAGEVAHDGTVSMLAETDELVVLSNDLGGALGEIEGEG